MNFCSLLIWVSDRLFSSVARRPRHPIDLGQLDELEMCDFLELDEFTSLKEFNFFWIRIWKKTVELTFCKLKIAPFISLQFYSVSHWCRHAFFPIGSVVQTSWTHAGLEFTMRPFFHIRLYRDFYISIRQELFRRGLLEKSSGGNAAWNRTRKFLLQFQIEYLFRRELNHIRF